jgi:dTDP-4-amino-4,6-dideoxygalactose transaminase
MDNKLYVGRPNLGDRDALLARISDMLDRRWLSNDGPLVQEFERKICDLLGVKHAVAMCNATVALEIASKALDLKGEVILPSYTFIATAHSLQWQGITPVFADMDPESHNLDPAKIEALITPLTTGIVGVHVWGRACHTEAIEAIATKRNLRVMYDASHGFGCSVGGRMLGNFGACEVFSFHATKFINCFEGGAAVTNDDALAEKMRLMRNFGFKGFDDVIYLGVNGKMSEVCAAMGLTNLEAMDEIIACNQRNYEAYSTQLTAVPGISLIRYDTTEKNNYQYVVMEVDPAAYGRTRDELVDCLHGEGVIARKYFWPGCHRMEPYRTTQPDTWRRLPATESVAAKVIVLPTGQSVNDGDVARVCGIIRRFAAPV